jgi:hypothetical protein
MVTSIRAEIVDRYSSDALVTYSHRASFPYPTDSLSGQKENNRRCHVERILNPIGQQIGAPTYQRDSFDIVHERS